MKYLSVEILPEIVHPVVSYQLWYLPIFFFGFLPSLGDRFIFLSMNWLFYFIIFPSKLDQSTSIFCTVHYTMLQCHKAELEGFHLQRNYSPAKQVRTSICSTPCFCCYLPTSWDGNKMLQSHIYLVQPPWKKIHGQIYHLKQKNLKSDYLKW